jgi:hypothetical protein
MKPELEVPITAEGFKPAMEKGALKRWSEEDGIFRILDNLLGHHQNDLLPIYNQRITNRTFATKHNTENPVCFPKSCPQNDTEPQTNHYPQHSLQNFGQSCRQPHKIKPIDIL